MYLPLFASAAVRALPQVSHLSRPLSCKAPVPALRSGGGGGRLAAHTSLHSLAARRRSRCRLRAARLLGQLTPVYSSSHRCQAASDGPAAKGTYGTEVSTPTHKAADAASAHCQWYNRSQSPRHPEAVRTPRLRRGGTGGHLQCRRGLRPAMRPSYRRSPVLRPWSAGGTFGR